MFKWKPAIAQSAMSSDQVAQAFFPVRCLKTPKESTQSVTMWTSTQPIPVIDCPQSEKVFPCNWLKIHLFQLGRYTQSVCKQPDEAGGYPKSPHDRAADRNTKSYRHNFTQLTKLLL